ncbi:2-hydroxycarboxylate transporter family protein [Pectobacterium brasiliense]|uniref:2-hydroxycarboxylate transporter family protein n=1 Tax=Pectobacterium TaxID=122277 RepID=UPI00069B96F8|nr:MULTISPECIES: 2-hydroxycarboxylate transporter family protein [Pectobacterium]MCA5920801.1 2-hydroxycarboxylate transporter family protein [Pectobacterium brasiliense]MCA5927241.1 2-hydroxycarboxylate transporter family protein [Pectobacterium brasiliense]MCA5936820.1 2-hydroxycarboxylate transporter family protein [Pectobacterium brasiliense]MCA5940731.1 2-hydroxycarboxylate transporter family protein [Pectobacterium brasiliense]MCA5944301.1 2-hydroxycarboxylate transporter family protein 
MKKIETDILCENNLALETQESFIGGFFKKKIGSVPVALFMAIAAIVAIAAYEGYLPKNMIGGFAVIMTMGFLLAHIGSNIPVFKDIGGPAILCLMVPSVMVYFELFNDNTMKTVHLLMKEANFLYFVIACLVVGSILGMNRKILIQGMVRMFVPLVIGTATALATGLLVGKLCGYSFYHTFFFIIVPIIGGGIGEGILPLSLAYSAILGESPDVYVAQLAPAAVVGNIFAILCAGVLSRLGMRRKDLNGEGRLVRSDEDNAMFAVNEAPKPVDFHLMGGGLLMICAFFIVGGLFEKLVHIPGPVLMILIAVLCKYGRVIPAIMETGAHSVYKFVSSSLVWPLMIGLGMLYIPLESVVAVFSVGYVIVCGSVVLSMALVSFLIAPYLNMYPIEASIVTTCHSGLGGTGDVAILSASNRMSLMPFAQIATRIGGASTVIAATLLLGWVA